ncbi:MAG: gamma-glutamyl-gamma-aminobutyrate hydrolase family protein [Filifactoraceae bacterium]
MKKIGITCSIAYGKDSKIFSIGVDYVKAVYDVGAVPVIIPTNMSDELAKEYANTIDALLVSGGDDINPAFYNQDPHLSVKLVNTDRDKMEIALIKEMDAQNKPIFGICRGLQLINVVFGGTLIQDIPTQGKTSICHCQDDDVPTELIHKITTLEGSLIRKVLGERLFINSYHHQAIDNLAEGFIPSAKANDGIIEAIEHTTKPIFAVQWHPEDLYKKHEIFRGLFQQLVDFIKE